MIKITYKTLRGWEDSEKPGWAEVDSLSESVLVDDRSIDVATANAGGPSQAFLLCRSGRVACGGAYTAVHSLGEVGALLVEHGKGANLPPASQGFAVIETATAGFGPLPLGCGQMKPAIWFQRIQGSAVRCPYAAAGRR